MMIRSVIGLVMVACVVACGRPGETDRSSEAGRARSGDLDVVLLADQPALSLGKAVFTVEFRAASDPTRLVDVGRVKASATMAMPGTSPMFGSVSVEPTSTPGRYVANSELTMAGEWRMTLEWDGPAGRGSASVSPMVQ